MTTIRVHFDGAVIIPDEPIALPVNTPLRITVISDEAAESPLARLVALTESAMPPPDWPTDGSMESDHYLYGTPKREQQ